MTGPAASTLTAVPPSRDRQGSSTLAIESTGLTKDYGSLRAVNQIDLQVPAGTVAGFVGPNGAGKTTTIRMLLGLIRPTAGAAQVLGEPITQAHRYLSRVGAMIEGPAFTPGLTGRRNLRALSVLGGHAPRIDSTLELVGLADRADEPVRSYSMGMKQRLGIAAALLGDPELLVLDEPTNGLDPSGIREIRQLLRDFADGGKTVFVSSHLMSEIEQVCDWLVMIDGGSLRFQGPVEEAISAQRPYLIVGVERPAAAAEVVRICGEHGYAAEARPDGLLAVQAPPAFAGVLNRECMSRGITLIELRNQSPSLEETFFRMLKEEE